MFPLLIFSSEHLMMMMMKQMQTMMTMMQNQFLSVSVYSFVFDILQSLKEQHFHYYYY